MLLIAIPFSSHVRLIGKGFTNVSLILVMQNYSDQLGDLGISKRIE